MKKLFVSVPMKGRTEEEIRKSIAKMHKIAEVMVGEELELITSYVGDNPPKENKVAIWYLSKSIEKLSEADVFIGISQDYEWNGCSIERQIANRYGIETLDINGVYVMDDFDDVWNKLFEKREVIPLGN